MSSDHYKSLVAVHLFLLKDDQVLLARRFNTGWGDGQYSVPAGHLEANETVTQAVIREAQEEVDVTVAAEDLAFAGVMHRHSNADRVDFFFITTKWSGEVCNAEPDKCDEVIWVKLSELPENTIPYIRTALTQLGTGKYYAELGWE